MNNLGTIGKRTQRLRLAGGLSQAELAEAASLPTGAISMIENGRQAVDDETIDALAEQLACLPNYLLRPQRDLLSTRPWLRAYADASKRAVDRYVADTLLAIEAVEGLGLRSIAETIPVFDGDLNDEHAIEDFAGDVRRAAGFDDGDVVGNSIRAAERLGCIVLPMDDELGRHMGMSIRVNTTPVIRVARPHVGEDGTLHPSGDRQRFTVAHELGHLSIHSPFPPPASADEASRIEKQANRFAGAFLTPAEPLLDDLAELGGRVTLSTLQELKARWGVAIKMLVVRMRQLDQISDHHARSLYKQISSRKWNRVEPVTVGHEQAVWLERAIKQVLTRTPNQTTHPLDLAAGHAGLSRGHFDHWVDWSPRITSSEPRDAEVVDLVPRHQGEFHPDDGPDAVVSQLRRR